MATKGQHLTSNCSRPPSAAAELDVIFENTMYIDVENELAACIGEIGGIRTDDLLSKSPNFPNADFLFNKYNIVSELKCLKDNKLEDKAFNEKLLSIYQSYKKKGVNVRVVNNGNHVTFRNMPQDMAREFMNAYMRPIKKQITKANKQIKATKKYFDKNDFKGVLILANDANLALDPEHIYHILSNSMMNDYSSINAVVFITLNIEGNADFTPINTVVWANFNRPGLEKVDTQFFEDLRQCFSDQVSRLINSPIPIYKLKGVEDLSRIQNNKHRHGDS